MEQRAEKGSAAVALPPDVESLMQALAAPFDPREVKFKPAVVNGHRAMAMAYIDARVIQDRLDEVLGGAVGELGRPAAEGAAGVGGHVVNRLADGATNSGPSLRTLPTAAPTG